MKPFLNKDLPSFLYVISIFLFGCFLAVLIEGKIDGDGQLTKKEEVAMYMGMAAMFFIAIDMYRTISKKNKLNNEWIRYFSDYSFITINISF